jgi:hypothetical protein
MTSYVASGGVQIGCLGDQLEAAADLEDLTQPATDDRVVIGDHHADDLRGPGGRL